MILPKENILKMANEMSEYEEDMAKIETVEDMKALIILAGIDIMETLMRIGDTNAAYAIKHFIEAIETIKT